MSEKSSTPFPQLELNVVFKYMIVFEVATWLTVKPGVAKRRNFEKSP